jgi:outer membrane receptor protein involved in Fe transport
MKLKATLLKEVIIKGQGAAIKIKGDTTEFNAALYTIQPNDKVEDLLKKLPGIQIDKDGKITAQGKSVPKVLVDGEEFFGDDPTLVTKNLRADMVDKVQLFEKTSDQAAFTGVDDGQKTTTINIKLKEDKKNGYFGKADVGGATDEFYQAQLMFNKFKARQKFSLYGTLGNNGKTGLSWEDANKYGSGNNFEMQGDMIFFSGSSDDIDGFEGQYYGEGLPIARNGGAHYDNKWNSDKETINTNYKAGTMNVQSTKNILSQNNLASSFTNSNSDEIADKYLFRQKLDLTYTIKLDTTSNLKIVADGTLKNSDNVSDYSSFSNRADNTRQNTNRRTIDNHGNEQLFNLSAFYNKKFKKLGRNYSINISGRYNDKDNDGYLKSQLEYFDTSNALFKTESVDQYKINNTKTAALITNFTYNEPLSKYLTLVLSYGFNYTNSEADKLSYNASTPGNYNLLDLLYSNDFEASQYSNQGGAVFNFKKLKTTFTFGTKLSAVSYNQYEALSNQTFKRSYLNWIPQLTYQYKFSQQSSFRLNYNGYVNQPTIDQLQPVKVNTDQLNIPIGNPNLKPAFNSSVNLSYNSYKVITAQSFYINGYFSFTDKAIVNNTTFDNSTGKSERQAINMTGKMPFNYNGYAGFSRKIKPIGVDISLNLSAGGSKSYSYLTEVGKTTQLNTTTTMRFGPRLGLNRYSEKTELSVSFGPSYNGQEASLQPERSNKGWGSTGYAWFKFTLPAKFTISGDAQYTYTPASASFDTSFEQMIINASITKGFFKKEDLKMSLKVNDLLDQNSGFSRSASANLITQTSYNNINRYFMLSLIWDFNKMGGGVPTKN